MPAVNIREDEKKYILELAVPGIDKKDLKIDINEDVLTISSESKNETEENRDGYKRKEFSYSSFCRSFYIPENVNRDKIEANYKDGILTVGFQNRRKRNPRSPDRSKSHNHRWYIKRRGTRSCAPTLYRRKAFSLMYHTLP